MASILPAGSRWRAQLRKRGQSIAKTFKTKGADEAWAREKEVEVDKGQSAADAATDILGDFVKKYREAPAEFDRAMKPKSNECYILKRLGDAFKSHFAARLTTMICTIRTVPSPGYVDCASASLRLSPWRVF